MSKKSKRSASAKHTSKSQTLTPDEVYNLASRQIPWGIEGYEIPRHYFDYHQSVWNKRRIAIKEGKEKPIWPPKDWPGTKEDPTNKVPPKRRNYLDDLYKWCNSFYDKARAQQLIEEKGINVKDYQPPIVKDMKRRKDFLDNERKKEEWKKKRDAYIPEYKEQGISNLKEKIKEHDKERAVSYSERMKKKYIKGKEQFARCDRVTIVADAEFVGEQIPFYNTPPNDDDDSGKNKKLFWPNKFYTMYKAPAWRICKPTEKTDIAKEKENLLKEKVDNYLNDKGISEKDLHLQVRQSYYNVTHHGKCFMKIQPQTDWKNEEHHQKAEEDHPYQSPGPDHYWRMPKSAYGSRKKVELHDIEDANGNKIYYMDRRRTDKRVYKSGMRKSVY